MTEQQLDDLVTAVAVVLAADEAAGQGHRDWDALPQSSRTTRTRYWRPLAHKILASGLVVPVSAVLALADDWARAGIASPEAAAAAELRALVARGES